MFDIPDTEESIAIRELKQMSAYADSAINSFIEQTELAYQTFWFAGASPQKKLEILGSKALDVFSKHAQAQDFIKTVRPGYIGLGIPSNFSLTWAADGSATLEPVEPEQPAPQDNE